MNNVFCLSRARLLPLLCLALSTLGCAMQSSPEALEARCLEAEEKLQRCTGSTSDDFLAACMDNPSEETLALVDELGGADCPEAGIEKADGLWEAAFVSQCAPAVGSALLVTLARNGPPTTLIPSDHANLRSFFGDLVDGVEFYFNASIINEWNLGFTSVQFGFDVAAQTLGHRVFVKEQYRPGNEGLLKLLAHELVHARQSRAHGGLYPGFANAYCAAFYQSGFDYRSNAMEVRARAAADAFSAE